MSTIRTDLPPTVNLDQYKSDVTFDPKKSGVGQGLTGVQGNAPPPPPRETIANALASLANFMAGGSMIDVDVLLVQVAVAMRDTEAGNQKAKINTDQETKKAQIKEKEAKLEEAQRKMDEAEEKKKSGSLIDKIKLAFEWIGAILAVAVAAVMIATGVGAVVGGLLIAAAVTSIIMAIDSTVQTATGLGIAGNIAKARGASEEEIAKADMGFKISMAVLGIAFSLAAGGASMAGAVKSAVAAGAKAAETASAAGQSIGRVVKETLSAMKEAFFAALKEAGSAVTQGAKMAQRISTATEAVVQAGSGAVEVGRSAVKYEETELRGEAKQIEAQVKTSEALIQMLDDMIDQALSRLMASSDRFNLILDDITEAMSDRGSTMSRARFSG